MSKIHVWENGVTTEREATSTEQTEINAREAEHNSTAKKLARIKEIRLQKLKTTDWMSASDYTMPDYIKTWRQTLRDLPQNNTTESQYDTLLATDADGNLTNSVWTQPKE